MVLVLLLWTNLPAAAQSDEISVRTWGGSNNDFGRAVRIDSNNTVYLTGSTLSFPRGDSCTFPPVPVGSLQISPSNPCYEAFILKYRATDELQWQRTWGITNSTSFPSGLTVDSSGDSSIVGWYTTPPSPQEHSFLIKYDSQGNLLWQETPRNLLAGHIAADQSRNIYVVSIDAQNEPAVQKLNSSGHPIWQASFGTECSIGQNAITIDTAGNIILADTVDACGSTPSGDLLLKLNPAGVLVWQKIYSNLYPVILAIASDTLGNFYIGAVNGHQSTNEVLLSKYDENGNLLWGKQFCITTGRGFNYFCGDDIQGIAIGDDGNIYVTIYSVYGFGSFLLAFSPRGELLAQNLLLPSGISLSGNIVMNSSGSLFSTGSLVTPPPYSACESSTQFDSYASNEYASAYLVNSTVSGWSSLNGTSLVVSGNTTLSQSQGSQDALVWTYNGSAQISSVACPQPKAVSALSLSVVSAIVAAVILLKGRISLERNKLRNLRHLIQRQLFMLTASRRSELN